MKVKKFVPKKKAVEPPPPEKRLTEKELAKVLSDAWECQQRILVNRARLGIASDGAEFTSQFKLTRQQELHQRQRDARSVGMPAPVALSECGENVYPWGKTLSPPGGWTPPSPVEDRRPLATPSKSVPQSVKTFKPVGGPGVIATIIKVLTEEASRAKPMTKKRLVARLVVLLPGRDGEKMAGTVRAQLAPSGLPTRGVGVRGDDATGYWIKK